MPIGQPNSNVGLTVKCKNPEYRVDSWARGIDSQRHIKHYTMLLNVWLTRWYAFENFT